MSQTSSSVQSDIQTLNIFTGIISETVSKNSSPSEVILDTINFDPKSIDLTSIPSTSGIFNATTPFLGINNFIFATGTYTVTNCIIDENDEIIHQNYIWNIQNPGNSGNLSIISATISDDTACDYYYYSDDYTPVSQVPSNEITNSNLVLNYDLSLYAMNYFYAYKQTVPGNNYLIYFARVNTSNFFDGQIYALNTQIISGTSISIGEFIDITSNNSNPNSTASEQILSYMYDTIVTILNSTSSGTLATLALGGSIQEIEVDGVEMPSLLFRSSSSELNLNSSVPYLTLTFVVMKTDQSNPFNQDITI